MLFYSRFQLIEKFPFVTQYSFAVRWHTQHDLIQENRSTQNVSNPVKIKFPHACVTYLFHFKFYFGYKHLHNAEIFDGIACECERNKNKMERMRVDFAKRAILCAYKRTIISWKLFIFVPLLSLRMSLLQQFDTQLCGAQLN